MVMETESMLWRHDMDAQNTHRIAVPKNRGEVVGLVHTIHQDRQVELAAEQHVT